MNTTTYSDGSKKVTYHDSAEGAVAEALADLKDARTTSTSQQMIDVYAPCPCGSGKKFKFCCRSKMRKTVPIL